ncbi:hypothetical protein D3C87_1626940 [compost metagenome]
MNVVAGADAGFRAQVCHGDALRAGEIFGMGDLDVIALTLDHGHAQPGPFGDLGVVGEFAPNRAGAHMGRKDLAETEALRRLGRKQLAPVFGGGDQLTVERALDGVGYRQGRHRAVVLVEGGDDTAEQVR